MATRSTIAIENANGTVTGIYCHSDGYVKHNGRILVENYKTEEAVRELIALGDLSSLGETVGEKTDFGNSAKGQCVAYGRDRGETGVEASTFDCHDELIDSMGQEYDYIFTQAGVWYDGSGDVVAERADYPKATIAA